MEAYSLIRCIITEKQSNKMAHYDKTKKMAHDSHIIRTNKTLNLSYGWPSQRKTSDINKQIKALRQGRH